MPDADKILPDGKLDYQYLRGWCRERGGSLAWSPEGGCRVSFTDPAGRRPGFFWLTRIGGGGPGQPLKARRERNTFTGPEAYLPGMLSVLLEAAAGAGRGAEIILHLDGGIPAGADPLAVHYFLLPTDFKLVLAHKGEYEITVSLPGNGDCFGCQEDYEGEGRFIKALEGALAPVHPIYPVGPGTSPRTRPIFLLGHRQAVLKSLIRNEEGLNLTYRLNTFPGDGPEEVAACFSAALSSTGRPEAGFSMRAVHQGGRSGAALEDLSALYAAYARVLDLPPDVEWFAWPSAAGQMSRMGYKTAAFGPGHYPDYLAGAGFDSAEGEKLGLLLRELLSG